MPSAPPPFVAPPLFSDYLNNAAALAEASIDRFTWGLRTAFVNRQASSSITHQLFLE